MKIVINQFMFSALQPSHHVLCMYCANCAHVLTVYGVSCRMQIELENVYNVPCTKLSWRRIIIVVAHSKTFGLLQPHFRLSELQQCDQEMLPNRFSCMLPVEEFFQFH